MPRHGRRLPADCRRVPTTRPPQGLVDPSGPRGRRPRDRARPRDRPSPRPDPRGDPALQRRGGNPEYPHQRVPRDRDPVVSDVDRRVCPRLAGADRSIRRWWPPCARYWTTGGFRFATTARADSGRRRRERRGSRRISFRSRVSGHSDLRLRVEPLGTTDHHQIAGGHPTQDFDRPRPPNP